MNPAVGTPYRVPPEPSRWPAILLAVAVHALLLAFLWFGISWQNNAPIAVEAEVWDMKVQAAAPTLPPPVEAEPEPEPEPPVQKAIEPPVEQPAPPPDINLEREKKRKEEQLKKEAQAREEKKLREEAKKKELAEKKALEEKLEKEKKDAEKKEVEKKEADKKKAEKAEKLAKAKADAAQKAKLDKLHDQELKRMLSAAGGTGTAAKSSAPRSDSGYVASITAKVKSTTTYLGNTDVQNNPRAEFRVEQLPTGEIISVKKTKSSGVPAFDDAVEKGIIKASPLPKKKDGTVERSLDIGFSMKDMN